MSLHSYTKVWIHFIWSSHNKEKVFSPKVREIISDYFYEYAKEKNIYMRINHVNAEHVHALIDLPTNLTIEDCIKLLKGSSSHNINSSNLLSHKFSWSRGYGAFSVSESNVHKVIEYIQELKAFLKSINCLLRSMG
jgi:REP element-mobilizing transposase RayT